MMTRKKNKCFTFLWSLFPGAGEMYLGFFKQGVSIMLAFLGLISLAGFLRIEMLLFLTPVIWFYSFFHTNHISSLPDDEFYSLEDQYILCKDLLPNGMESVKKYQSFLALCLIFIGVGVVWNMTSDLLFSYMLPLIGLDDMVESMFYQTMRSVPQVAVAVVMIVIGIQLIRGKKETLDNEH